MVHGKRDLHYTLSKKISVSFCLYSFRETLLLLLSSFENVSGPMGIRQTVTLWDVLGNSRLKWDRTFTLLYIFKIEYTLNKLVVGLRLSTVRLTGHSGGLRDLHGSWFQGFLSHEATSSCRSTESGEEWTSDTSTVELFKPSSSRTEIGRKSLFLKTFQSGLTTNPYFFQLRHSCHRNGSYPPTHPPPTVCVDFTSRVVSDRVRVGSLNGFGGRKVPWPKDQKYLFFLFGVSHGVIVTLGNVVVSGPIFLISGSIGGGSLRLSRKTKVEIK